MIRLPIALSHRSLLLLVPILIVGLGSCKSRPFGPTASDAATTQEQDPFAGVGSHPIWAYDPGPDPNNSMTRELIDINASIPSFPNLSEEIYGDQMFRPAFGPIPWRMLLKPNSVKILFIGQDGTHIAEAAGRPATAGFGGRAQDLAKYFGVGSSAAFINTYAFTIRWQYGNFNTPFVWKDNYKTTFGTHAFVDNQTWLLSQDLDSPIVKWRNELLDWIIRNNRDSLKMIVLFGGAARDAAASYVISKGGVVEPREDLKKFAAIKIPEHGFASGPSNSQMAYPFEVNGGDLYKTFQGNSKIDYRNEEESKAVITNFTAAFKVDPKRWFDQMTFSNRGFQGTGMLDPAQWGGYDLEKKMKINGKNTISLKGLKISNDLTIDHDILVTQLPHPTALSMMGKSQASESVSEDLKSFDKYVQAGWKIEPDSGYTNSFAAEKPYVYSRGDMGTEFYDFGAPNSRMVNISSASRLNANVISFGTRERADFDEKLIETMKKAKPSELPPEDEMWTMRPQGVKTRYIFDAGPGEEYAKLMKTSLPTASEFRNKYSDNGDFGHYRGTFKNPKVVIIADPYGEDDLITARALTGSHGQYLHGLMDTMGIGDQYLVLKTAPYSMNTCADNDWPGIFEKTKPYRKALFEKVFKETTPQLVILDGDWAVKAMSEFKNTNIPTVTIKRGKNPEDGIAPAIAQIKAIPGFKDINASTKVPMKNIPRTHLSYYARWWEGTSGDRVIADNDSKYCGTAFAVVAPNWATSQKHPKNAAFLESVQTLKTKLDKSGLRYGGESLADYRKRQP